MNPPRPTATTTNPTSPAETANLGPARILAIVFLPFTAGYFLSYTYRTINAVIADDLSAATGVGAEALGLLTAAYFITFAAAQLPLGIVLDRFGPRRTEAALLLVAAAGAAVFSQADGLPGLTAGRALIGLGVAACLMAALKANVLWWPKDRLPLVNGAFMAAGGSGAIFATTPVAALLTVTDWRGLFLGLSALTLATAALIWLVVPERRDAPRAQGTLRTQIREVATILSSPLFWRLAPASTLVHAAFLAYAGLWAGAWLRDVGGFGRADVASHLFLMAVAMVTGFLLLGVVAERLSRYGVAPVAVLMTTLTGAVLVQIILLAGIAPQASMLWWTAYGFLASGGSLIYAILSQATPPALAGRVNTAANMLMFVLAFLLQSGIGAVVSRFDAPAGGGFSADGHRAALGILIVAEVVALLWFAWSRRAGRAAGQP
ncbi:MAG TPA: MFS transporter [Azospirillaceae bacterium]|nr:MFS transporter [Azospirillaceae bacterium]